MYHNRFCKFENCKCPNCPHQQNFKSYLNQTINDYEIQKEIYYINSFNQMTENIDKIKTLFINLGKNDEYLKNYREVNCMFYSNICREFVPDSEIGKIVVEIVKGLLTKFIKNELSVEEKKFFETCKNIVDTFNDSTTLINHTKTDIEKAIAITNLITLWEKYFSNPL